MRSVALSVSLSPSLSISFCACFLGRCRPAPGNNADGLLPHKPAPSQVEVGHVVVVAAIAF